MDNLKPCEGIKHDLRCSPCVAAGSDCGTQPESGAVEEALAWADHRARTEGQPESLYSTILAAAYRSLTARIKHLESLHDDECFGGAEVKRLAAELATMRTAYESVEWSTKKQTEAYQSAFAEAERGYAVCSLAVRAREVVFDDPGDAARWGEAVNDWKESAGKQS